jgi:hypothetical protein
VGQPDAKGNFGDAAHSMGNLCTATSNKAAKDPNVAKLKQSMLAASQGIDEINDAFYGTGLTCTGSATPDSVATMRKNNPNAKTIASAMLDAMQKITAGIGKTNASAPAATGSNSPTQSGGFQADWTEMQKGLSALNNLTADDSGNPAKPGTPQTWQYTSKFGDALKAANNELTDVGNALNDLGAMLDSGGVVNTGVTAANAVQPAGTAVTAPALAWPAGSDGPSQATSLTSNQTGYNQMITAAQKTLTTLQQDLQNLNAYVDPQTGYLPVLVQNTQAVLDQSSSGPYQTIKAFNATTGSGSSAAPQVTGSVPNPTYSVGYWNSLPAPQKGATATAGQRPPAKTSILAGRDYVVSQNGATGDPSSQPKGGLAKWIWDQAKKFNQDAATCPPTSAGSTPTSLQQKIQQKNQAAMGN